MALFQSRGVLEYHANLSVKDHRFLDGKLIVVVDPNISLYYRSLVPKWMPLNPQKYPPHISVVRREVPPNMAAWGKYQKETIDFTYSNEICNGKVYYWLNAFSKRLEEIRTELGLSISSEYTRPPDSWTKCFHITIGNCKT